MIYVYKFGGPVTFMYIGASLVLEPFQMLLWKQLLAKLTQYKKDYLNSSSPHPSLHLNKNQKLTKQMAQIDPSLQEFVRDLAGAPGWLTHVA